jgi:uncharacterized protein DUF3135
MIPKHKTELDRYTRDEMRELYKTDPKLFDKLAAEAINEACIGETPEETLKLRQIQRLIDSQLEKAETPLERMRIMENIFYSNVFDLARIMETFAGLIRPYIGTEEIPTSKPVLWLVKK